MAINKITAEQRELMRKKSAQALPDVPSSKGWTPKQFKDSITKPLFDNENSLFAHINRVSNETNKEFEQFDLNKVSHEDAVHKTGYLKEFVTGEKTFETNDGTAPVHLKSSFPYIVSDTASKVGMRAYTQNDGNGEMAGQIAVSYNEEYGGHFANMQARDNEGTLHTLRVSKMGATYHTNKNGVSEKHNIPFDEKVVHIDGNEAIEGNKTFKKPIIANEIKTLENAIRFSTKDTQFQIESSEAYINGNALAKKWYADSLFNEAKGYTDSAIAKIIDNAPQTLDTFKEIASYIAEDETKANQMLASINKNKQDIATNTNQINALENNKLDKEDLIYENVENAPEKLNIVVRDTISADTYNEAREIQIGKDKFKFGSGSKIKANEFVDGTLPTLEYLNIDGETYKLPNYVVDKSGLKLVYRLVKFTSSTASFSNVSLENNKVYIINVYPNTLEGEIVNSILMYKEGVATNSSVVFHYNIGKCFYVYSDGYGDIGIYDAVDDSEVAVHGIEIYELPLGESAQTEKHNKTINVLMQRVSDLEQKAGLTSVGYVQDSTLNLIRVNVVDDVLEVSGFKFDGEVMII